MQRFSGRLRGLKDTVGKLQAVSAACRGRSLVVGGVHCNLPVLAVVVSFHPAPGVPVPGDVYFRGGRGCFHCVPADELDGADHRVGSWGRLHEEDVVYVLGRRSWAQGVFCRPG